MNYHDEYQRSLQQPEQFWAEKAAHLAWYKQPETILSTDGNGIDRWFSDGLLNTAYLTLDYHVEQGRGEQTAIIYDSPVTQTIEKISYYQLTERVAQFAGALKSLGVGKGDRVLVYLPMTPEAAIAMLACARLGAIHSVVFGGFSSHEVATRIDDAKPVVVVTASCGIEFDNVIAYKPIIDEALELATHKVAHCIVAQRPQLAADLVEGRDYDWNSITATAEPADCEPVLSTEPLYILYTSGTTGKPKGVVRDNGGHAVAMHYSMKAIYNMEAGDTFWAASDVGWVVGHSYIVYAPLLAGCTSVLYEGKPVRTPDAGAFWRVASQHKVKAIFSAPTAFRAIRKEDPEGKLFQQYDLSHLKAAFLAGERTDPPTYHWLADLLQKPVIDHWWQTETGWAIVANMTGLEAMPAKPGSATLPVPGFNIAILDDQGETLAANEQGNIAIKLPLPPACLPTIWNDFDRFQDNYLSRFPGYYQSGDGGYIDEDGYVFIMGRTDDVINVAGHRFSTGEMEEILGSHTAVAECAVVGIHCKLRGQVPLSLVILKDTAETLDKTLVTKELIDLARAKIGAVAYIKTVLIVNRLPKTRSGKILRKILRHIADGEPYATPSTIDDPAILDEIKTQLEQARVGIFANPEKVK